MDTAAGATGGGRLGSRIVAHFLLAASVPVLVLALLAWSSFTAQAERHAQRQLDAEVGAEAMRVFDRLIAARTGLQLLAGWNAGGGAGRDAPPAMFRSLVAIDGTQLQFTAGAHAAALERWWHSGTRDAARSLHWQPAGDDGRVTVVLAERRPNGRSLWLAEIDPAYLWGDVFESIDTGEAAVVDHDGRRLHTNGAQLAAASGDSGKVLHGTHALFLQKEFGADDWTFRAQRPRIASSAHELPIGGIVAKVVLAALLLVAVLSLVQVRRTMDPLGRLVAVTRQLAGQDYAARVALAGDDEFGELARSFNEMAAQLQGHAVAAAAHEQRLQHDATHDGLTGLLNLAGLRAATGTKLAAARPFALMLVDLDRFKSVNDIAGHLGGDELLRQTARRLLDAAPAGAQVARPGGDEFVVMLDAAEGGAPAPEVTQSICTRLAEPFTIEGREFALGASVGWALYPDDGSDAKTLARRADLAMRAAKERGGGRAARYEPGIGRAAEERAWIVNDLRHAVERAQLVVHYQPRVEAHGGHARSAEALVRWRHPERGLVSPALFIPVAEETGAIRAIGRWVLDEACRQMAAWQREGVAIERVSVNLSAVQLAEATLFDEVVATIHRHGLSPRTLELEITESAVIDDDGAAAEVLGRLRALGIAIALDDFGTGYSSMAYLSRMPVDVIKIDRAFVQGLGRDASADGVTRAIVALAKSLGLALVAEGVETIEQADALRAMGCEELQGFLYSRPVPAADYVRLACVAAEPGRELSAAAAASV